ncbi:MAG: putative ABC transport system ATP-binding protein, partial [Nitriliruptoraceae bacterium]
MVLYTPADLGALCMSEHTRIAARPSSDLDVAVRVRGVTKRYGAGATAVTALDNVDLDIPVGQFLAVMGPSGSGKSTLLHVVA